MAQNGDPRPPLATVLIRTYQSAVSVQQAIASVLAQTLPDLECLIVDDGSTDGTEARVACLPDARVRYVRLPTNLGRAAARKVGLALARGTYIGILDADDWWYPEKLERQVNYLQAHPELGFVSTGVVLTEGGRARAIESPVAALEERFPPLRRPGPLAFSLVSALLKTTVAREAKLDLALPRAEDFCFMLQLALAYPFAVLREPLYAYECPARGRSAKHFRSLSAARSVYAKYLRKAPLTSLIRQAECITKQAVLSVSSWGGAPDWAIPQRGRALTADEHRTFDAARATVDRVRAELSAGTSALAPSAHGTSES